MNPFSMLSPGWGALGGAVAITAIGGLGLAGWAYFEGKSVEREAQALRVAKANADARVVEREGAAKAFRIVENQHAEEIAIRDRVDALTRELRESRSATRLARGAPAASCAGATGAELSLRDGEFLTRLAGRAERMRNAYRSLAEWADLAERVCPSIGVRRPAHDAGPSGFGSDPLGGR